MRPQSTNGVAVLLSCVPDAVQNAQNTSSSRPSRAVTITIVPNLEHTNKSKHSGSCTRTCPRNGVRSHNTIAFPNACSELQDCHASTNIIVNCMGLIIEFPKLAWAILIVSAEFGTRARLARGFNQAETRSRCLFSVRNAFMEIKWVPMMKNKYAISDSYTAVHAHARASFRLRAHLAYARNHRVTTSRYGFPANNKEIASSSRS